MYPTFKNLADELSHYISNVKEHDEDLNNAVIFIGKCTCISHRCSIKKEKINIELSLKEGLNILSAEKSHPNGCGYAYCHPVVIYLREKIIISCEFEGMYGHRWIWRYPKINIKPSFYQDE